MDNIESKAVLAIRNRDICLGIKQNYEASQCLGNFCTLINPDCEKCQIDELLDEICARQTWQIMVKCESA